MDQIFNTGPFGRSIMVDASGALVINDNAGGEFLPYAMGSTGRIVTVDGSGRLRTTGGTGGVGGGEANTASNVGSSGVGVFKQKSGVDLQFKKLVAGSNVTFVSAPDSVRITGPAPGEANTASNVGAGSQVFKQKSVADLQFRTLTAASGIVLSQNTDDVQIKERILIAKPFKTIVGASGSTSIDLAQYNNYYIPLSNNISASFTNPEDGAKYTFVFKQLVGGKTVSFSGVYWVGGTDYAATAASGSIDFVIAVYVGPLGLFLSQPGYDLLP